jgi:xanthine dehydrogenase small subunit
MSASSTPEQKSRQTIQFVHDGVIVRIDDADPNRTVLQYLREDLKKTGTKEGCAEGDCGACTVVVAEIDAAGKRLQARAINSCIQFLPTLDGKELITVESLSADDNTLHPLQKALVDCHASQCGFCTPGFVMSLFALYKSNATPTRCEIDDALAGNLCRCTGYSPIVTAAEKMYTEPADGEHQDWAHEQYRAGGAIGDDEARRIEVLRSLQTAEQLAIEHDNRKFFAPKNVSELAQLTEQYPAATILAGGTDIGLWVTKQHKELQELIYTGNVAELQTVSVSATHIEIGAAVSMTDAMQAIVARYPALEELFLRFASPPIRNAATLGGNIANGSPIGDSMPVLLVLDASLLLRKGASVRPVPLSNFYIDYQHTALRPGEFIEQILLPLPAADEFVASYKVSKRFDQDISAVCGAYRLIKNGDRVGDIKIAYGGMAAIPKRADNCEQALLGKDWSEAIITEAISALENDFRPISDMRASAPYRQTICGNLLRRFYLQTTGEKETGVYAYGR